QEPCVRLTPAIRRRYPRRVFHAAANPGTRWPSAPPCLGNGEYRLDHVRIGAAPADMAADRGLDVLCRRLRIALQQGDATEHQPRRAEAALQRVVRHEG